MAPEYYEVPQLKTSDYVISNTEIDNLTRTWFSQYQGTEFVDPDTEYNRFKKVAQREVNYLVKEFECKKVKTHTLFFYFSYWCPGLFQTSHLQVQRRSLQEGQCCS